MSDLKFWQPPNEVMAVDVSGLAGIKLTYVTRNGEHHEAVIGGVDHYVGVSLVKAQDKASVWLCLGGPMAPEYRKAFLESDGFRDLYVERFPVFVSYLKECVRDGKPFRYLEYCARTGRVGGGAFGFGGACPFGV